jgi:hypothetical protein
MKREILLLKAFVLLLAVPVLALCLFVLPVGLKDDGGVGYQPIILGMYISAIPFFIALYQTIKLLGYIETHKAFSLYSADALKNIKYCALTISGLYGLGMPYIFYVADKDDAPGVVLLGLVIVFASFAIGTAAAVFQKLVQHAVDIKSENDLTV